MPILGSNGKGAPLQWQRAYDAFLELQRWAHRAGEPTAGWTLRFPTLRERLKNGQWELTYTEKRVQKQIYVGWDSLSTASTLRRMIPTFRTMAQRRTEQLTTERTIADQEIAAGRRLPPIFDPVFAERLLISWQKGIANVRTRDQLEKFKRENKRLMEFLNQQAGVLDMTMLQYLTKHPDAKKWPNPPRTAEEWYRRHPERKPVE